MEWTMNVYSEIIILEIWYSIIQLIEHAPYTFSVYTYMILRAREVASIVFPIIALGHSLSADLSTFHLNSDTMAAAA